MPTTQPRRAGLRRLLPLAAGLALSLSAAYGGEAANPYVAYYPMTGAPGTPLPTGTELPGRVRTPTLNAAATAEEKTVALRYDADVPGKVMVSDIRVVNPANESSLSVTRRHRGAPALTVADHPDLHAEDFTLEMYVKIRDARAFGRLALKNRANDHYTWNLHLNADTGQLRARVDSNPEGAPNKAGFNQILDTQTSVVDDRWHHIAAVYDSLSQRMTLYIDHEAKAAAKVPLPLVYDGGSMQFFDGITGLVDEIRLSDRPLTPEEFLRIQP